MTTGKKPEVNLEINSGFLRISAEDAIYNITVLDAGESSATRVVEKIVEAERLVDGPVSESQSQDMAADIADASTESADDDFYKSASNNLYRDIGKLAKNLSATLMDLPAEDRKLQRADLNDAGEKIEDAKKKLAQLNSDAAKS